MRNVTGPTPGTEREFIPESFDNRLDPDPIRVWLRTPTEDDRRAILSTIEIWQPKPGEEESIRLRHGFAWQKLAVKRHVTKITGYTVRGEAISDGEKLSQFGETQLLVEIASEIVSEFSLKEEEKKTSAAPSDSKSSATEPLNGTAQHVSAAGSTLSEAAA